MAYESTTVAPEKSQQEIAELLRKHGAARFTFGEDRESGTVGVEFTHAGYLIRMVATVSPPDQDAARKKASRSRTKSLDQVLEEGYAQELRRVWRVVFHALKARLVAVEEGLETFEQAFLPHLVNPATNTTLWTGLRKVVESPRMQLGGTGLPQLGDGS